MKIAEFGMRVADMTKNGLKSFPPLTEFFSQVLKTLLIVGNLWGHLGGRQS